MRPSAAPPRSSRKIRSTAGSDRVTLAEILSFLGRAGAWLADFVKDYQTLIAGLIAILAAYMTAKPVWRQLRSMSVQTAMVHREFLAERLRALDARRAALAKNLDPYSDQIHQRLMEMREIEGKLNIHWVFERAQITWSLINDLKTEGRQHRDPAPISIAFDALMDSLNRLYETLEDIHRPQSTDQSDEDHEFTDAEWADIGEKGKIADARLDGEISEFEQRWRDLKAAFETELSGLRDSLQAIDAQLTASAAKSA